jgi:GTP-binding protein
MDIRNVAIVAHVDHGKTTMVDAILRQIRLFRDPSAMRECFLDSGDLERERGITILAKNISIVYRDTKINIIDTPGHSDFGGQVERVLKMADGVLLLVDAAEGPMPQTRFVLEKALALHLIPIVVINKADKPAARIEEVHEEIFDLFVSLGASNEQLDFPLLLASGRDGWAVRNAGDPRESILPVLDVLLERVPPPPQTAGPVQMQVATLDYSDYCGRIGIGRVYRGTLHAGGPCVVIRNDGSRYASVVKQIFTFEGIERREQRSVAVGDLCAVVGPENLDIGDTVADAEQPEALPPIAVDEPTLSMVFRVNDSPFCGRECKYSSSRHLRERLLREAERDVALRVADIGREAFEVRGRGVLHLSILLETMRREGYEMQVSQPHVILKTVDGRRCEPFEMLTVHAPSAHAGRIIEMTGQRGGEMTRMEQHDDMRFLEFRIATRGMIGLRSKLVSATGGEAVIAHRFLEFGPDRGAVPRRTNGALVSMETGVVTAYALDALQSRGFFFVDSGERVYEGMVVGEHCKEGDLVVNLQKGKQLTNMRAAGSDRKMKIAPPVRMSLEEALEYVAADETVEVTPQSVRLRKVHLSEGDRRRLKRQAGD